MTSMAVYAEMEVWFKTRCAVVNRGMQSTCGSAEISPDKLLSEKSKYRTSSVSRFAMLEIIISKISSVEGPSSIGGIDRCCNYCHGFYGVVENEDREIDDDEEVRSKESESVVVFYC